MPQDHFSVVTALDGHRNDAMKKAAGIESSEKPSGKVDHSKAIEELGIHMAGLRRKGRELMAAGKHNTPEYDDLVAQNKEARRKLQFMEDSSKDKD